MTCYNLFIWGFPNTSIFDSSLTLSPPLVYGDQPVSPGLQWSWHSGFVGCWGAPPPPDGVWPSALQVLAAYLPQIGPVSGWTPAAFLQNPAASLPPNETTKMILFHFNPLCYWRVCLYMCQPCISWKPLCIILIFFASLCSQNFSMSAIHRICSGSTEWGWKIIEKCRMGCDVLWSKQVRSGWRR